MKIFLAVLLIFGGINAALSAQIQLSAGLGGNFTMDFTSATLTKAAKDAGATAEDYNSYLLGGGFYAFFDASYVEANIGLLFGNANSDKQDKGSDVTALKLGVFGKYPIALGSLTLFPMLGIDGHIWLAGKNEGKDITDSKEGGDRFNQLWFKAGAGVDIPVAERFYIRAEALYGIRLNTNSEQDVLSGIDVKVPKDPNDPNFAPQDSFRWEKQTSFSAILGHGLDIRIAFGFKF